MAKLRYHYYAKIDKQLVIYCEKLKQISKTNENFMVMNADCQNQLI